MRNEQRTDSCNIALKEWSATCRALELGRQIILLRKGGLLDAEGKFDLEYSGFWLAPTKWHEDASLVKPQHQDLLQPAPAARGVLRLASWAQVEKSWAVSFEEREKLARLEIAEDFGSADAAGVLRLPFVD